MPFIKRMRIISPTEVENEVKIESLGIVFEEITPVEPSPVGGSIFDPEVETTTTSSASRKEEEEVASRSPRAFFAKDAFERAEGEPPKRRPYFKSKESSYGRSSACGQEAIQKVRNEASSTMVEGRALIPFFFDSRRLPLDSPPSSMNLFEGLLPPFKMLFEDSSKVWGRAVRSQRR